MRKAGALERMQFTMDAVRGRGELRISYHRNGEDDMLVGTIGNEHNLRWWITCLMQVLKGCATEPRTRHPSTVVVDECETVPWVMPREEERF